MRRDRDLAAALAMTAVQSCSRKPLALVIPKRTNAAKRALSQFFDVEIVRLHSLTPRRGEPRQDTVTIPSRKGALAVLP